MKPTVVGIAIALLLAQGIALAHRVRWSPPEGPTTGELLPTVQLTTSPDTIRMTLPTDQARTRTCALLVAISVTCEICRAMRADWPRRFHAWRDSVGRPVAPVWIGLEEHRVLAQFTEEQSIAPIPLLRVEGGAYETWRRLGIIGTPISYLIDSTGRLRYGIAGPGLPPPRITQRWC